MSNYRQYIEEYDEPATVTPFRCSDRMCGADDCDRCFPRLSTRKDILPADEEIDELLKDMEGEE